MIRVDDRAVLTSDERGKPGRQVIEVDAVVQPVAATRAEAQASRPDRAHRHQRDRREVHERRLLRQGIERFEQSQWRLSVLPRRVEPAGNS